MRGEAIRRTLRQYFASPEFLLSSARDALCDI
jgi:hypothetical protein